jgi:hypothetical protein
MTLAENTPSGNGRAAGGTAAGALIGSGVGMSIDPID